MRLAHLHLRLHSPSVNGIKIISSKTKTWSLRIGSVLIDENKSIPCQINSDRIRGSIRIPCSIFVNQWACSGSCRTVRMTIHTMGVPSHGLRRIKKLHIVIRDQTKHDQRVKDRLSLFIDGIIQFVRPPIHSMKIMNYYSRRTY